MMDFTRRQFRNHRQLRDDFPNASHFPTLTVHHLLDKNADMDSDSDDDLIASLVVSGMKGGAKAVGDDFLRFQRGERGESSRGGGNAGRESSIIAPGIAPGEDVS